MSDASPKEPLIEIRDPDRDRYASLDLIRWWDQERLRQAQVMVVGAGALGNEVLKNLALLGVGKVLIVDCDRIEASNLSRSILFRLEDTGRRKVDVAAEQIRHINPDVQVIPIHGDVRHDLGAGVFRRMDVVLGCLDNRAARLAVNRACYRVGVPWIDGALDILMGLVRVFIPPDSACYECTLTEQDYQLLNQHYACPQLRPEDVMQGRMPTTPTSASIIGALQVQEAVKLLHGLEVPAGTGFYFNGQTYKTSLITYSRRQDCPSHDPYDNIIPLDAGTDTLTVGAFLDLAAQTLGEEPILLLERELVRQLFCPQCQQTEAIYRPFAAVVPDLIPCPDCPSNRIPDITTRLTRQGAAAQISLKQIGVPGLAILKVESGHHPFFFELKQDEALLLPGWTHRPKPMRVTTTPEADLEPNFKSTIHPTI